MLLIRLLMLASRLKPSNHAHMRRIFSVCFFVLMLSVAKAQTVSSNDTNPKATNSPHGLSDAEIGFVPDATNSAAQTQGFHVPAKDTNSFFEEIKTEAEKGDPMAQYILGGCYDCGNGVEKDLVKAVKWYRKSAEQNNGKAQYSLGLHYRSGEGVELDFAEAVKWWRKAADQNHVIAQCNLGFCYANGEGVPVDKVEAVKWYRKSAEQDNAMAECNLGLCYGEGEGVDLDMVEAVKWFKKSSSQDCATAQYNLGISYFYGDGVVKDYLEAYKWELLAAAKGVQRAKKVISMLENKMSQEQIAEGQKLARDFVPTKASESYTSDKPLIDTNPRATGTGFFITDDGYFITNYHVVKDAVKVRSITVGGILDATVVKMDAANDLALLKVNIPMPPSGFVIEHGFDSLPVAASRTVKLGATVATVGFPDTGLQGFSPKLAKGEIGSLAGAADDPRYFQISVPVQHGNSGGALVDVRGNVVGIVAARLGVEIGKAVTSDELPENVNYAVKSSLLLSFLESEPDVASKIKEPNTKDEPFEDVVKSAQDAAVLVLVY